MSTYLRDDIKDMCFVKSVSQCFVFLWNITPADRTNEICVSFSVTNSYSVIIVIVTDILSLPLRLSLHLLLPPDIFPGANGRMVPGNQSYNSTISAPSGTYTHTLPHTFLSRVCLSFSLLFLTRTQLNLPQSQHPLHTVQSSWHTSPLTLRQCVSSEPAVITTVDPLLTHDCLGTRTAGPTLAMDGIRQSEIEHTVPHVPTVCLHSTNSHTCVVLLIRFTDRSQGRAQKICRKRKGLGGEQTKRFLGVWRALVLMDGGFTCSLALCCIK